MSDTAPALLEIYQGWEHYQELLIKALAPLPLEQVALRPAPHLRSVGENARHIIGARARWCQFVLALGAGDEAFAALGRWDDRNMPERSGAELASGLRDSWQVLRAALAGWTPEDLAVTVRDSDPDPGDPSEFTRQWVIWHLIEHDLHHGGEISQLLGINHLAAPDL
ncbi:MAG TPA: DinB family protein [Ktedonobacterales bacterium]|nr:DinB family protein [Ktedonobacterales bacterium]